MKIILSLGLWMAIISPLFAQRYTSESSKVVFFSEAPMENIEAYTNQASSIFDLATKQIVFSVPVKTFTFEKPLMQEHFNENYMESDKYPKSIFKGTVTGFENKPGKQSVSATGELMIHGVSQKVSAPGTMELKDGKLYLQTSFPVKLNDYKVEIPKMVFYKIAETVDVRVNFQYRTL